MSFRDRTKCEYCGEQKKVAALHFQEGFNTVVRLQEHHCEDCLFSATAAGWLRVREAHKLIIYIDYHALFPLRDLPFDIWRIIADYLDPQLRDAKYARKHAFLS